MKFALFFRPFLFILVIAAGIAVGGLVVWKSHSNRHQVEPKQTKPVTSLTDEKREAVPPPSETPAEATAPAPLARTDPDSEPTPAKTEEPKQGNALPPGVSADAVNPEVYKKLPGVQPPIINDDGRDMSAEALSMLKTKGEPVPMPGSSRSVAATSSGKAMPFPKTVDEINRQAEEALSGPTR
jgi:hypothetical protein